MKLLRKLLRALILTTLVAGTVFIYIGLQGNAIAAPMSSLAIAQAAIQSTAAGSDLSGLVTFTPTDYGMVIEGNLSEAPQGFHGFHIHENGSCADGGSAAGGHFNPDGVKHGKLVIDGFSGAHAGDLGNIIINADGDGILFQQVSGLTLTDGKYAIANRAIILHEKMDDFGQPTGNAGGRIGCGVIQVVNP